MLPGAGTHQGLGTGKGALPTSDFSICQIVFSVLFTSMSVKLKFLEKLKQKLLIQILHHFLTQVEIQVRLTAQACVAEVLEHFNPTGLGPCGR